MSDWEVGFYIVLLVVIYLVGEWFKSKIPPACHCDDSDQGRACLNCQPPRLPRR